MSRLLQLRDRIVERIRTAVPNVEVEGHLGRFDEAELKKFMVRAPAIRVAVLALEDPRTASDEGVDYTARVGIYAVAKDGAGKFSRDEAAIAMIEAVLLLTDRQRWGLPFCLSAQRAAAQNLYTPGAQADGVALWAIDLRQPVRLVAPADDAGALTRLFLGFAPDIGAAHVDDYIELGRPPEAVAA